jgi:Ca2+-dependent lipid-binding protein
MTLTKNYSLFIIVITATGWSFAKCQLWLLILPIDLVKRDVFRKPDPYARISINLTGTAHERFTKTVEGSLSPLWNETFVLPSYPNSTITVQIFDKKYSRRPDQASLGIVHIPLNTLDLARRGKIRIYSSTTQ